MTDSIIITGSAGLVGQSLVSHLSGIGYEVIEIDKAYGHDLTNEDTVRNLFARTSARILINAYAYNPKMTDAYLNGSMFSYKTILLKDIRKTLETNLVSLFSVCREFIITRERGSIINFASIYGLVSPSPKLYSGDLEKPIDYGISKAATISLTKQLAVLSAPNFYVNCIAPGGISNGQDVGLVSRYSDLCPSGRMMDVSEILPAVEFLISAKNTYTTGSVITVDGGWTSI